MRRLLERGVYFNLTVTTSTKQIGLVFFFLEMIFIVRYRRFYRHQGQPRWRCWPLRCRIKQKTNLIA